jgi:hypothetical protein
MTILHEEVVGVLVDYPDVPKGITQASIYKTESIINWRTAVVNGMTKLVLVVLTEQVEVEGKDEFEVEYETHYRVLDLFTGKYRQRVYRINKDKSGAEKEELVKDESFPKMAWKSLDFIPMYFIKVNFYENEQITTNTLKHVAT